MYYYINNRIDKNGKIILIDVGNLVKNSVCFIVKLFNILVIEERYFNIKKIKCDKFKGNLLEEKIWNYFLDLEELY